MAEPDAASPVDAIVTALSRLRGRRGPRPPWAEPGAFGDAHEGAAGGPGGRHRGGPFAHHPGPWGQGGPGGPSRHERFAGPARLRLLEALLQASAPLSVGELAERIGVDQPRASRLVQQAVEMGLARREADPDDARRTRVALTDEGRRIVGGFRGERRGAVETALAEFTDAERAELARLLTKLADGWPRG